MILDTNALSAFADGNEDLFRVIEDQAELAVPVVVLGEYLFGIRQSKQRARYEQWLRDNMPLFELLGLGRRTAEHYAQIRLELKEAGRPIPGNDLWIAALSREHLLPVVSRDRHFDGVRGLRLFSW